MEDLGNFVYGTDEEPGGYLMNGGIPDIPKINLGCSVYPDRSNA